MLERHCCQNSGRAEKSSIDQRFPRSTASVAIYSKHARFTHRSNKFHLFSGFGKINRQFIFGGNDLEVVIKQFDISAEVGQCTYFKIDRDEIVADTDLLGHGHIFTSQHDGYAVISNRLHIHTIVLRSLEIKLELNRNAALSLLFSTHVFFSQQYMSHDMLPRGVSLVAADKRASVKEGLLEFQPKRALRDALTGTSSDYEYFIEAGVQDVLDNSRVVLENPAFGEVITDLTGGKDSRLVFGSVLGTPGWRNRIALNSTDVPNSQDLPIACGIANHFGAHFYRGSSMPQAPVSAERNLQIWRSYFQGMYNRIGAAAWTYEGRNTDSITLSGGSGEILRTFWDSNLRQYLKSDDSIRSFATRFVAGVGAQLSFGREEEIADHLFLTLSHLPGDSLNEKLESHYLFFRNRSHFGLRGFSFYHERPTWFPLMSASLLKAAHSLPFAERAAGKVVQDVMRKLDPILTRMPFDGKGFQNCDDELLELNTDRSAWERANEEKLQRLIDSRTGRKPTMVWSTWANRVLEEAIRAHEEAQQISATYREIMPSTYIDQLRNEFSSKSKASLAMASSLFAVRDSIG